MCMCALDLRFYKRSLFYSKHKLSNKCLLLLVGQYLIFQRGVQEMITF